MVNGQVSLRDITVMQSNYHVGHVLLEHLKKWDPEAILQTDAATGEQESAGSVLARSCRLARCCRRRGLWPGDVMLLAGRNHLHLRIPYNAALFNGLPIAGVDPFFKYNEIKKFLSVSKPKIAFCDDEKYYDYKRASEELGLDMIIVTFGEGTNSLTKFMDMYDDNEPLDEFQPTEFDTDQVFAWLMSTSGSTGMAKLVAFKHHHLIASTLVFIETVEVTEQSKGKLVFNMSPIQWVTCFMQFLGLPLLQVPILQTSSLPDIGHFIDVINKYKPNVTLGSPSVFMLMLKHQKKCDFTCFDTVGIGGAKAPVNLLKELRSHLREDAIVKQGYGQTELPGVSMCNRPDTPDTSCGYPLPRFSHKLVDPQTQEEVTEPYKIGEIWTKGPESREYYNNPEETAAIVTEDGWLKSGDLLYRDETGHYYFVERVKLYIKSRGYTIAPTELEDIIMSLPGVKEVGVTSIPHTDDGQQAVACVVRHPGCDVTAQEIKQFVLDKLAEGKQLRGGVVFLAELPKTSTGKLARPKLQEMVLTAKRE